MQDSEMGTFCECSRNSEVATGQRKDEGNSMRGEVTGGQWRIFWGLGAHRPGRKGNCYLFDGKPLADLEQGYEVLFIEEAVLAALGTRD